VIAYLENHSRGAMGNAKPYHFTTKRSTFSLDVAPTSRARCRGCKRMIEKGELRLVTHAFVRPGRGTRFVRHAQCVTEALAREVVSVHRSVECVPVCRGVDALCLQEARTRIERMST
jgi:hypothetical protein